MSHIADCEEMRVRNAATHRLRTAALILALAALAGGVSFAQSRRAMSRYRQAVARLIRARTLHVKVHDNRTHGDTEYWLMKPNRYKVFRPDGSKVYCDGRREVSISPTGEVKTTAAPRTFPFDDDDRIRLDFQPFWDPSSVFGRDLSSTPSVNEFGGVKRRSYSLMTTPGGVYWGHRYLDPITMLPVGHHTEFQDNVETDQSYPIVQLNPPLRISDFRPPQMVRPASPRR